MRKAYQGLLRTVYFQELEKVEWLVLTGGQVIRIIAVRGCAVMPKRKRRKRVPETENEFLLDNAEALYDRLYGFDRNDRGCGGGTQKPKHTLDGDFLTDAGNR